MPTCVASWKVSGGPGGTYFPGTLSSRLAGFGSCDFKFLSLVQVGNFCSAIQFTNSFLFILLYLLSF